MAQPERQLVQDLASAGTQPENARGQKSFANTLEFVAQASIVPLDSKPSDPESCYPPLTPQQTYLRWSWIRTWEITGLYLGTDRSLEAIGSNEKFRLTRERVRQIINDCLNQLHQIAPEEIKIRFPLDSLGLKNRRAVEHLRNLVRKRNRSIIQVEQLLQEKKSIREIRTSLGLTSTQLSHMRGVLRRWGIELPYQLEGYSQEYRQKLGKLKDPTLSCEESQRTLDIITHSAYRRISKGDNPLILPISKVAKKAGLFISRRDVVFLATILKKAQIPTGQATSFYQEKTSGKQKFHRYHFVPRGKVEEARHLFETHPQLERFRQNPVQVIGCPLEDISTISQLKNSDHFLSVGTLLSELGCPQPYLTFGLTTRELIAADCPVPVFVYRPRSQQGEPRSRPKTYYLEAQRKEELRTYLKTRLAALKQAS